MLNRNGGVETIQYWTWKHCRLLC